MKCNRYVREQFWHLPGGTEENHELVSGQRFEPRNSQVQSRSVNRLARLFDSLLAANIALFSVDGTLFHTEEVPSSNLDYKPGCAD
jgi:hypothetical protein